MKVGVIGAGLSGLVCARTLAKAGHQVTVFEKSRSLGGRCATRKFGEHVVDHGLQFFTLGDDNIRAHVENICGLELLKLPAAIVATSSSLSGMSVYKDGEPRFYLRSGNNRIGHLLAEGLDVVMETAIAKADHLRIEGKWKIADQKYDAVVSCAPWPQSASLLDLKLPDNQAPAYDACLTVLLEYAGERPEEEKSLYARIDPSGSDPLAWVACEVGPDLRSILPSLHIMLVGIWFLNSFLIFSHISRYLQNAKEGRVAQGKTVYVVQASPAYSQKHLEQKPEVWVNELQESVERVWNIDPKSRLSVFCHRWRYARRLESSVRPKNLPPGFFLCGDSTTTSTFESVWKSGLDTATDVLRFTECHNSV